MHGLWNKANKDDRCPKCSTNRNKSYNENIRDKESSKIYNSTRWRKLRKLQLENNPFCVICGQPAKIADHIIEIKDGGNPFEINNLQSMCISCHNTKTAKEKSKRIL